MGRFRHSRHSVRSPRNEALSRAMMRSEIFFKMTFLITAVLASSGDEAVTCPDCLGAQLEQTCKLCEGNGKVIQAIGSPPDMLMTCKFAQTAPLAITARIMQLGFNKKDAQTLAPQLGDTSSVAEA